MSQAFAAAFTMVSTRYGVTPEGGHNNDPRPSTSLFQLLENIPIRGFRASSNSPQPNQVSGDGNGDRKSSDGAGVAGQPQGPSNTSHRQRQPGRPTQGYYKAPIFKLPPELLAHIFFLALPTQPREPNRSCAPLSLSQTCNLWRGIALATPTLWSTLSVNVHLNPSSMEDEIEFKEWCQYVWFWFSRAGAGCTLEIKIITVMTDHTSPNKSPFGVTRRRPDFSRLHTTLPASSASSSTIPMARPPPPARRLSWFSRPTTPTRPTTSSGGMTMLQQQQLAAKPNTLAQFLLPIASRVRALEFKIEPSHLDALRGLWTPLNPEGRGARWDALEEFHLNAPVAQGRPYRSVPAASSSLVNMTSCPNLKKVWISSSALNLMTLQPSRVMLPMKQLRSIRLREDMLRYRELLTLLKSSRYLVELIVSMNDDEGEFMVEAAVAASRGGYHRHHRGNEAPYLRTLSIHSMKFDPAFCLVPLTTPSLTTLSINYSQHLTIDNADPLQYEIQTTALGRESTIAKTLIIFQQRSYCHLQRLSLNCTRVDQLEMFAFLRDMPTIEELELQNCGCTTKYFVSALRWWHVRSGTTTAFTAAATTGIGSACGGGAVKGKAMVLPRLKRLVLTDLVPNGEPAQGDTGVRVGSSFSFDEVLMDTVESRWWTSMSTATTKAVVQAMTIPVDNSKGGGFEDDEKPLPIEVELSTSDGVWDDEEGLERLKYVRVMRGIVKKGAWRDGRIGNAVLGRIRKVADEGMDIWYTKGGTYPPGA